MKLKTLYFDCFAGASGDMIVGALLDLGLDEAVFTHELAKLNLSGYRIKTQKVVKSGFSATKFNVQDEAGDCFDQHVHTDEGHEHHHPDHETQDSGCRDNHIRNHTPHRNITDIVHLIESSDISTPIKVQSIAVFQNLACAEAKIHGISPEEVHFHEVGAVDAIVDIVGAVTAVHLLEIEKIVVSPLPLGQGFVHCQHGVIPVPAPATLELLTGLPTYGSKHNGETVTPTGAAILATLGNSFGLMPALDILKIGYGAGTRDLGVPNMLRAIIGWETCESNFRSETIICLEANIDDMNPEFYEYIMESLLAQGAHDVFLIPIQMKKNRPAQMIRVLCTEQNLPEIAKTLFTETSSIGLRFQNWNRFCLERAVELVDTPFGEIRVKKAFWDGKTVNLAPEYDDCKKKAQIFGVPLKDVYQKALESARAGNYRNETP